MSRSQRRTIRPAARQVIGQATSISARRLLVGNPRDEGVRRENHQRAQQAEQARGDQQRAG